MNEHIAQKIEKGADGRYSILYDWYPETLPENIVAEDMVYLDTSYSFSCFHSLQPEAFSIGYGSGNYLHSHFFAGKNGKVTIGKYVIMESTLILSNDKVTIGDHGMFSWGSVITDSWLYEGIYPSAIRKDLLKKLSESETRFLEMPNPKPVCIEDNVWVGFGSVILPGVRLGRGCVVGCRTVISSDVPPYAIIVGDPSRIVKFLNPDDTEEEKLKAIQQYSSI